MFTNSNIERTNYKQNSFISYLKIFFGEQNMEKIDENREMNDCLLSLSEFENELQICFSLLINENLVELYHHIIKILKCLMSSNVDIKKYSQIYQVSQFGFKINSQLTEPDFNFIAFYIIEIFIMFTEKDDDFCIYLLMHDFINTIIYLRDISPMELQPLLYICMYNICSIINQTKFSQQLIQYINGTLLQISDEYNYIIPLVLINVFRNQQINDSEVNSVFFRKIKIVLKTGNIDEIINSMWCLYYWFKNSYIFAESFINKSFIKIISSFIKCDNEICTSIALYIYSILYYLNNPFLNIFLNDLFEIEPVIKLMKSDSASVSSHAISLCNNYIASSRENSILYRENSGLEHTIDIIKNSHFQSKVEAGFLLITYFSSTSELHLPSELSPDVIDALASLICFNDPQLQFSILTFLIEVSHTDARVPDFLNMLDLQRTLEDFLVQRSELSDLSSSLLALLQHSDSSTV